MTADEMKTDNDNNPFMCISYWLIGLVVGILLAKYWVSQCKIGTPDYEARGFIALVWFGIGTAAWPLVLMFFLVMGLCYVFGWIFT